MNQINLRVRVRVDRLNIPLPSLHARLGHSVAVVIEGVPDDVTGVFMRVIRADGSYYDFPANLRPNGEWLVYIIGTAFSQVLSGSYEVHATDARGNATALGCGLVTVRPFTCTTEPITPGSVITVAQIPTKDGAMVQVRMVQDSTGEWVQEAVVEKGE